MYSNCCCSCSFEPKIIEIGQSSHKMYSNNILNFQESTTILNDGTKKSLDTYRMHLVYVCMYVYVCASSKLTSKKKMDPLQLLGSFIWHVLVIKLFPRRSPKRKGPYFGVLLSIQIGVFYLGSKNYPSYS